MARGRKRGVVNEERDKKREGRAVEKERKVENALFFVVGAHARAIVCLRVISLPNLHFFFSMEIRHPGEYVNACVYFLSVLCLCVYRYYCVA